MRMFLAKIIVFAIIYFIILRPLQAAFAFTRPPRFRISFRTPADTGLDYEEITLTARDGAPLTGWYIPSQNGAAILLLHGHSGNRLGVMAHAETLAQAGYGILMLDLRRHGSSGGRVFGRGEIERDDVLTAVTYLHHRPDITPGSIGIYGVSIGGLFALHAAAHTVAIHAIAVDGASPATMQDLPTPQRFLDRFFNWPLQRYYMAMITRFARQQPLHRPKHSGTSPTAAMPAVGSPTPTNTRSASSNSSTTPWPTKKALPGLCRILPRWSQIKPRPHPQNQTAVQITSLTMPPSPSLPPTR
jgi:pimeloyl-ACP methyl ester carboxylesterase